MPIVTVFSGSYCSADQICREVAQRLAYGFAEISFTQTEGSQFDSLKQDLAHFMTEPQLHCDALIPMWNESIILMKSVLARLLTEDNLIYHGPAMHLIPLQIEHIVRVGLTADKDYRLDQAIKSGIGPTEAHRQIDNNIQETERWSRLLFSGPPWESSLYDIKLHLPSVSESEAVEIICEHISNNLAAPTEQSLQALHDFQLASQISMVLLEHAYHYCGVLTQAGNVTVIINPPSNTPFQSMETTTGFEFDSLKPAIKELIVSTADIKDLEIRPGAEIRQVARTLLVDDEREYLMTLSERLELRDIACDMAFDGYQALSHVKLEPPDVMVLDIRMPGIDGIEVLKRIRRDHPRIQVITVTGHGSDEHEKIVRDLGAFDYLNKPVDISILSERIKAASRKARNRIPDRSDATPRDGI